MTRREVELRYRDAMLGRIWIIVSPFLLLLIYTFVFGFVLKSRWGGSQSTLSFALTLFSGLLLNGILAESLSRAPTIIQANANYVKKLVFPWRYSPHTAAGRFLQRHARLPGALYLSSLQRRRAGLATGPATACPAPFLLCVTGLAWFLAGLGVYVRDIGQFVQFLLVLLLFISPVFSSAVFLATGNAALPVPQSADDPGGNGQGDPFRCSLSDPWGLQRLLRCVAAGLFIGLPLVPSGTGRFCRCPLRPFPRARR